MHLVPFSLRKVDPESRLNPVTSLPRTESGRDGEGFFIFPPERDGAKQENNCTGHDGTKI